MQNLAPKVIMMKTRLFPFALLLLSQSVFAQQLPNAGTQIRQIPVIPTPPKEIPKVEVEPRGAPPVPDASSVKLLVKSLRVTGAQVYSEESLLALTGFTAGSELTLAELRGMAEKIGIHYRSNGYFLAQAYLPAQDIKDGAVTIAVIEGRYGKVAVNNQTNLSDGLAKGYMSGLNEGDLIEAAPLENRLLLLSDLPGVNVSSTLLPGAAPGTSDLLVGLTPGQRVTGEIDYDNAGNRYTGEHRLGGTININNPLGLGDVASLRGVTTGPGLHYARASYQLHLGKATAGIAYSALEYKLGEEYEPLGAHGTAKIASIFGSYPVLRSRNNNFGVGLLYEDKTFKDEVDLYSAVTDKDVNVLTGSLYGEHRDRFGGGGLTTYSLAWSGGKVDIRTPAALLIDQATAKTNGNYSKLGFRAMRLQRLSDSFSLYAAINGQVASKNLDSSEKMELGGMYAVRGYPEGEAYGDEGAVLNLELRYLLPRFSQNMPGQMHLIGFVDAGTITTHKDPWAPGSNTRNLSAAGLGFSWWANNDFLARAYYAWKLGDEEAISAPDKSGRFWVQLVKYF
jgi:hemolysin activation/secretion protein